MATSSIREGSPAVVNEPNEQTTPLKPSGWNNNIRQFWHDIVLEMKKVSWPTRQEVINTTIIVVVAVVFFSLFLLIADLGLTYVIQGIEWIAKKIFI